MALGNISVLSWGVGLKIVVGVVSFLGALGFLWKLARFLFKVDRALPILISIANQFEANDGKSLKESLDELVRRLDEQDVQNRFAVKIAEDSRLIAETNAHIVNELSGTSADDLHDLKNQIAVLTYKVEDGQITRARIEERPDKILIRTTGRGLE